MGWLKSVLCGVKWFFGYENDEEDKQSIAATPFVTTKQRFEMMEYTCFLIHLQKIHSI